MSKSSTSKNKSIVFYLQVTGVLALISLPFLVSFIYRSAISPDPNVVLAGGLEGGRYDEFLKSFVAELKENSEITEATAISTGGSYDNLKKLEDREIDFALFQGGSDATDDLDIAHDEITFVSNVFPEVAHFVVREGLTDEQIRQFKFSSVAFGVRTSGDYRVGVAVVEHLNLNSKTTKQLNLSYSEIVTGFQNGEIDLAIISVGIGAEVIRKLIAGGHCRLLDFPMSDAFLKKHVAYTQYTIPMGTYFSTGSNHSRVDVRSVAVNAQLLTHKETPSATVSEILRTLSRSSFLKKNQLVDLFKSGKQYAKQQPEFALHPGASRFYDPSIRPWINPDFVEATEGIRSFVFSGLIGLFLLVRWLKIRNDRSQAHKLDEYIHRLLAIEQDQMALDQDYTPEQIQKMECYLDEITELRREALEEFTAHELNDDPAIECFISMSHALTEKVNAKLTRDAIRKLEKA